MITVNAVGKPDPVKMTKEALEKGAEEISVIVDNPMTAINVRRFLEESGLSVLLQDDDGRLTVTGSKKSPEEKPHEEEAPAPVDPTEAPIPEPTPEPTPTPQPEPTQEPVSTPQPEPTQEPAGASTPEPTPLSPTAPEKVEAHAQPTPEPQTEPEPTESPEPQATLPKMPRMEEGASMAILLTGNTLGRGDDRLGEVLIKSFLGTVARMETPPTTLALMNGGVKLALFDSSTCDHLKDLEKRGTNILVSGACTNHYGITESIGAGVISNMYEIMETLSRATKILSL